MNKKTKQTNSDKALSKIPIAVIFLAFIFLFGIATSGKVLYHAVTENQYAASDLVDPAQTKAIISYIDDLYNEDIWQKNGFINYNGGFHRLAGHLVIRDADPNNLIVKTADNQLVTPLAKYDVTPKAENTNLLADYCAGKNIHFLYVQAPTKIIRNVTQLPTGITDYANTMMDEFAALLQENDTGYLDLRTLSDKQTEPTTLFFRTDHHWQTKTAFAAFQTITQTIAQQYGIPIDQGKFDLNNYTVDHYDKCFLGSQGRRVGSLYDGLDDYDFIYPDFETNYTITYQTFKGTEVKTGDFMTTMVIQSHLNMSLPPSTNRYASYFGEDYPAVIIQNNLVDTGKILLIKDSYSLPVAAFLSTTVHELCMLDPRYYTDMSIFDYINQYQPDLVILMYSSSALSDLSVFQFDSK